MDLFADCFEEEEEAAQASAAALEEATTAEQVLDTPAAKATRRGRPSGIYGSSVLREYMESQDADRNEPVHSIEVARQAWSDQARARREQLAVAAVPSRQRGVSRQVSELAWLEQLGEASFVSTEGNTLQQELIAAACHCHCAQIDVQDPLIEHQRRGALASISYRALQEQVQQINVGRRVLEVASAFLELGCLPSPVLQH